MKKLLIILVLSMILLSGCTSKINCENKGGVWKGTYNCGPGGCSGGYCICPEDTSGLKLCPFGTHCECKPSKSTGCYTEQSGEKYCFNQ